jgi:uncharacterized protein YbaR (Trm112 family)
MAEIDKELLDILACPIGKADLKLEGDFLVCARCGVKYPIKDGIPVLLIDEAILPEGVGSIDELKCRKACKEGLK